MTEETKTNQRKWDESEAYFNKEFPDHEDGCLYGKIVVKAAYTAGVESREEYEKKLLLENIDQHNKIVFLSRKVQDLQKENAELKAQLESERDLPAIAYMQGAEKQKKKDEKQLTKAKEIIKEFLHNKKTPYLESELELFEKAEAFLKE